MRILFLSDFVPTQKLQLDASIRSLLDRADKIVLNLEASPQTPQPSKSMQIMPFDIEQVLRFFNLFGKEKFVVALANNHILDNGFDAFDMLISVFQKNQIEYFGTKDRPYVLINNSIGILNFVTAETVARISSKKRLNYLFYDTERINQQIEQLESKGITRILYPHWGRDMDSEIFKTYHHLLKINRHKWLIFGHHPHLISGVSKNQVYSLGNTFIPHPFYYQKYPGVRYGLAVLLDSCSQIYDMYLTEVRSNDDFKNDFLLVSKSFEQIPDDVSQVWRHFSKPKKFVLRALAFQGNWIDLIRLWVLQLMTFIFAIRIKRLKR